MTMPDDHEKFELANNFALKWFEIHAQQRMSLFRFFLLASAFIFAAYFASLKDGNQITATILALLLLSFSICFKLLDVRCSQLMKNSESHLEYSEGILSKVLGVDTIRIVSKSEIKNGVLSYRQIFNIIFWVMGVFGLVSSLVPWIM